MFHWYRSCHSYHTTIYTQQESQPAGMLQAESEFVKQLENEKKKTQDEFQAHIEYSRKMMPDIDFPNAGM